MHYEAPPNWKERPRRAAVSARRVPGSARREPVDEPRRSAGETVDRGVVRGPVGPQVGVAADLEHDRLDTVVAAVVAKRHVGAAERLVDRDAAERRERLARRVEEPAGRVPVIDAEADHGPLVVRVELVGERVLGERVQVEDHGPAGRGEAVVDEVREGLAVRLEVRGDQPGAAARVVGAEPGARSTSGCTPRPCRRGS